MATKTKNATTRSTIGLEIIAVLRERVPKTHLKKEPGELICYSGQLHLQHEEEKGGHKG